MLFNEPKLLKYGTRGVAVRTRNCFSALQRAEIAEIEFRRDLSRKFRRFSALQRAEIAEIAFSASHYSLEHPFQCSSTSRNC